VRGLHRWFRTELFSVTDRVRQLLSYAVDGRHDTDGQLPLATIGFLTSELSFATLLATR